MIVCVLIQDSFNGNYYEKINMLNQTRFFNGV